MKVSKEFLVVAKYFNNGYNIVTSYPSLEKAEEAVTIKKVDHKIEKNILDYAIIEVLTKKYFFGLIKKISSIEL